ncbi:MAG: YigZ family protein [Clostridiales bacterium]|nr:YigZ family protein [Clostridiales bacterium]HBM81267.1 YigZ family protein [Clostridiaceae bacterium]
MNEYRTIYKETCEEIYEKKSRFICNLKHAKNEAETAEFIRETREKYRDATHNVFAYVVYCGTLLQKQSDDGEPHGTAGMPALNVIRSKDLVNVCVVVTRYFGGILLGAGGLIRAYSQAVKRGVEKSGICTMALHDKISIKVPYTLLVKVKNAIDISKGDVLDIEYTDYVRVIAKIKYDSTALFIHKINEISNGKAEIGLLDKYYDICPEAAD